MTSTIAPIIRKIIKAVRTALRAIRRFAVANTRSTASLNREASRFCWLNAWTIFIAPSTSVVTVPTAAMRSWLRVEIARTRRPSTSIGARTIGMPISIMPASFGARNSMVATQPMDMTMLRKATETVVPTTCSMMVVSTVMRDVISAGLFSSKKPGDSRRRLRWTASRMSATVLSPSQDTK
jgi:hypothetical protein